MNNLERRKLLAHLEEVVEHMVGAALSAAKCHHLYRVRGLRCSPQMQIELSAGDDADPEGEATATLYINDHFVGATYIEQHWELTFDGRHSSIRHSGRFTGPECIDTIFNHLKGWINDT
tara:strand:+ start:122 stop:478 length:357 start_codon:yes stop_codon:yes gene_type:complete